MGVLMANSAEDKRRFARLAEAGCVICGSPACIHHIRPHGAKRDNKMVIALCHYHHQGEEGIHHLGKKEWRRRFGHEMDYLEEDCDGTK